MIKLRVSDTVKVHIKGVLNDEAGRPQQVSFALVCRRLLTDELQAQMADDRKVPEFIEDVTTDWSDVLDDDGRARAFSRDDLRQLLKIPGVAGLAFSAYLRDVGAREKN